LAWRIEFTRTAERQIRKLGRQAQANILEYLGARVQPSDNPRQFAKALHGDKVGLCRYRVGN
jgi:mRNA interferase RelE/StbE